MPRVKLTPGRIRGHICLDDGQSFLWDSEVPGLAVRATTGSKAFVFQGKLGGRSLRVTIGDVKAWGIDGAREEARRLQTLIDKGTDPRNDKAERVASEAAKRVELKRLDTTVGEAWTAYIAARTPAWGARHLANHVALAKPGGEPRTRGRRPGEPAVTMPGPIFPLLSLSLPALNSAAVRAWLKPLAAKTPTQAAQAYRALRAFVAWAADPESEYCPAVRADACKTDSVKKAVPATRAKKDTLLRDQLPAWFAAVRSIGNPIIVAFLQILLLIGARRGELALLRWKDVDFQWNSLTIRDKVDGERRIPMTPYVASLLLELKRINETPPPKIRILHGKKVENDLENWKPSPWVFSSKVSASGRLVEPAGAHQSACEVAGIDGLTLHGLRRSFKNLAEWVEMPVGVVAQVMGHKPSATAEKHYTSRPLDLLHVWHSRYEAWILEEAGIEFVVEQKGEKPTPKLVAIAA